MRICRSSKSTSANSAAANLGPGAEPAAGTVWGRAIRRAEDAALAALLGGMIVLSSGQIFLRDVAQTGVPWIDPLLRAMVLWVGLVAAVVAARSDHHISTDVVSRLLPSRLSSAVRAVTSLFAAGVAGMVALHAGQFVTSEREVHTIAFAGISAWVVEIVIPVAFAWIALRYLFLAIDHLRGAFALKGEP